jgi:hypothetical protein
MDNATSHIGYLRAAEAQFRLATAARLATTFHRQPLDLPIRWAHGRQTVSYAEIALGPEEADFGAWNLQRSATFLMAAETLEAIRARDPNPKASADPSLAAAYQIARLIRNAFAHAPFNPLWRVDPDCRGRQFTVPDVITLDTTGLDGKPFDWRHYGGPLAILALARFVRCVVLGDKEPEPQIIPLPARAYYQQGDLILERVPDSEGP